MSAAGSENPSTPLPVVALVSRVVTKIVDRITGDRGDYPLMVASAGVEALKALGVEARVMYGQAAWLEILENGNILWAGCWGENFSFWIATQFGEIVDLNTSVAHKKRAHSDPSLKAVMSPPMLWSSEVPRFYRYVPEGVAELDLAEEQDKKRYATVLREVQEKCRPEALAGKAEPEFPNEPILCPGRRLLDDSIGTFKEFDRAIQAAGIPLAPF